MGAREAMFGALAGLFDFGRVTATGLSATAKQVLATIEGNDDGRGGVERVRNLPLWGHAALLFRPKAATSSPDGVCEVFYVRRGDELVPVASRDLRWQVELEEGDVVLRNMDGTKPVRLWLKADGTALLEADTIKLGDSGATEKIGLGTAIKNHFNAIDSHLSSLRTALIGHVHPGVTVGAGSTAVSPGLAALATPPSVPDVESRHLVEN